MKISRAWLQNYFEQPLPDAAKLADALTFHAFEIESVEGDILDVKITPNRGHDCLCCRGIAKEVSAILNVPMKFDPLRQTIALEPKTDAVRVTIEEPNLCPRFTAAYITGLRVGPSPEWLRSALESIGQRSINNVVDATNYVMFDVGQPLHAFDAGKLSDRDDTYALAVGKAKANERFVALDRIAHRFHPTGHGAFGDCLTELRHHHVSQRAIPFRSTPSSSRRTFRTTTGAAG